MTRKSGPSGSKGKGLTADDHELWQHTARSLEPLKRAKGRVHRPAAKEPPDHTAVMRAAATIPHGGHAPRHHPSAHPDPAAKPAKSGPAKKQPPELSTFDPRNARKLRRGHIEIEARIALHGMRQSEAHAAPSRN